MVCTRPSEGVADLHFLCAYVRWSPVELNLNNAACIGSIPTEIGLLANLTTLGLKGDVDVSYDAFSSNRGFSGSIPSEIGKLSQLGKCHPVRAVAVLAMPI